MLSLLPSRCCAKAVTEVLRRAQAGVPCACLPEPPPIDSCRRVLRPDRAAAVVCVRGSCAVKYVDRRLRCCVSASHAALRLRWGAAALGPPRYEASTDEEAK